MIAKALYNFGVRQNDMVSIVSDNRHDYVAINFGVLFLNAILAPINYTYTERKIRRLLFILFTILITRLGEIRHALNLSKPKIIFVCNAASKIISNLCDNLSYVQKIVNIDENATTRSKHVNFSEFLKNQSGSFNVYENVEMPVNFRKQSAVIFLSSGTTGLPKGKN